VAIPDPSVTDWVPIWHPESAGAQGPPGATGPQGPQGPAGINGTAAPHQTTHQVGGTDELVNNAWRDRDNNFTIGQHINTPNANIVLNDTAGPVDQKIFRILSGGGTLYIDALNDAQSAVQGEVFITRAGGIHADSDITTVGSIAAKRLTVQDTDTFIYLTNLIAAADNKTWRLRVYQDGGLYIEKMTDAGVTIIQHSFQPDGTMLHNGPYINSGGFNPRNQVSANPTVLDYYEEGTFTPIYDTDAVRPVGPTYNTQTGKYVRIGNVVHCSFTINIATLGSTGSGTLYVGGFPFINNGYTSGAGIITHFQAILGAVSSLNPVMFPGISSAAIYFKNAVTAGIDGLLNYALNVQGGTQMIGAISYMVQ
jgi:hypothetical protein